MKYKVLDDDEVVKVKLNLAPFSIRLTCCDCGLTHDVKILKHKGLEAGEIEMIFSLNRRSTARHRQIKDARHKRQRLSR